MSNDPRARVAAICGALPEVTADGDQHVAFRVRGRTFAWYLEDHHGDGRVALCCKAAPGEQQALVAADPARYYRPAYLGARGWVAVRLDTATSTGTRSPSSPSRPGGAPPPSGCWPRSRRAVRAPCRRPARR